MPRVSQEHNRLFFYLADHLGSTRLVIDSTGRRVDEHRYYCFGGNAGERVSSDQSYKYTGKPFDNEYNLDLYYYGARYYDADLGRFTQIDPLRGKYPAWGPYVYCANNPLKNVDPDGRELLTISLGTAAAVGVAAIVSVGYCVSPDFREVVDAFIPIVAGAIESISERVVAGTGGSEVPLNVQLKGGTQKPGKPPGELDGRRHTPNSKAEAPPGKPGLRKPGTRDQAEPKGERSLDESKADVTGGETGIIAPACPPVVPAPEGPAIDAPEST